MINLLGMRSSLGLVIIGAIIFVGVFSDDVLGPKIMSVLKKMKSAKEPVESNE